MTHQLLDGKKLAQEIQHHLKDEIAKRALNRAPGLAFLLIGQDPGSLAYVRMKKRACEEVGIHSRVIHLDATIDERHLIEQIENLNQDPHIDGFIVQQPLPSHIATQKIVAVIDPHKDVDGFHPLNLGKLVMGDREGFTPCTPLGIQMLLKKYQIPTAGKHIVIVGRSQIVGKPMALLMLERGPFADATVTVVHSRSQNMAAICQQADLLIAAAGSARLITEEMVKEGAVVIDVGINRTPEGRLIGDVDFERVAPKTKAITPVPGGIGPLTIAMLLSNTWKSYLWHLGD